MLNQPNMFQTQLDIVKFLGLHFWNYVFGKQIDNLKTNNQGTFVIYDRNRFLGRISGEIKPNEVNPEVRLRQQTYSFYIIGLIKGALKNLGVATGGKQVKVSINEMGKSNKEEPFEIHITIIMPQVSEAH